MSEKAKEFNGMKIPDDREILQEIYTWLCGGGEIDDGLCTSSGIGVQCFGIECSACILGNHAIDLFREYMSQDKPQEVKDEVIFQVGDRVECISGAYSSVHKGTTYIVAGISKKMLALESTGWAMNHVYNKEDFKLLTNKPTTTKEETMSTSININSTVAKVFPNSIEDAKLVTKFFGNEYDEASFRDFMYLRDNAAEVLKEAKDRQKEEDAKK